MNPVSQNPFEEEKKAPAPSKIGIIWWVIIAMVGLTVLGGVGALLTDNVAFFLSLIPLLLIPALLVFGFYILCELLSALEFIGYCFEFVAWCGRKIWGGVKFIFGFRSEPDSSSKGNPNQQEKSMQ